MAFRTIDTDIWSNAFFDGLKVGQKLLFIYLFSNPLISNIGILETTRARIAYETGTSVKAVNEFLDILEEQGRIVTDGQYILNMKFIAKQTHFGGTSEANKNDRLLKNLLQLFNACPSEKLRRALQQAYPGLFCARQAPCEDETSPLPNSDKPLVSEQKAPSSCEVSPLSTESKPLAQEGEGSGGDIGDIGDIGEVDHTPLPPQGGTDAAASDTCEHCEPHTDANTSAEQPLLSPEKPPKAKRKRTDYRRADLERLKAMYPKQIAIEAAVPVWEKGCREGWIPDWETIEQALVWQIPDWERDNFQFVPNLSRYLKERRWNDKPRPKSAFPGARPQAQPFYGGKPSDAERNAMNIQAACNVLARQAAKEGVPFPPTNFDTINTQEVFVAEALPCGQENLR